MKIASIVMSIVGLLFRLLVTLVALVLIYRLGSSAYEFGYRVFSEPPVSTYSVREIGVVIPDGSSAQDIGGILERAGLIRDSRLFVVQERLSAWHGKLQSGSYMLNTGMTAEEIMQVLAGENEEEEEDGK